MRYRELSKLAKILAVHDYLKGWWETHPEETYLTFEDIDQILSENNNLYTKNGKYKDE